MQSGRLKQFHSLLRNIDKTAALDRLHDDDWLSMLTANLIALPGLHRGILPIQVIELRLHIFHLRVSG